jgi:hypothetical protein
LLDPQAIKGAVSNTPDNSPTNFVNVPDLLNVLSSRALRPLGCLVTLTRASFSVRI